MYVDNLDIKGVIYAETPPFTFEMFSLRYVLGVMLIWMQRVNSHEQMRMWRAPFVVHVFRGSARINCLWFLALRLQAAFT